MSNTIAKQLSGMSFETIAECICFDYRKEPEFVLTPEHLLAEALAIKSQQVENCWSDEAERVYWESTPCAPLW